MPSLTVSSSAGAPVASHYTFADRQLPTAAVGLGTDTVWLGGGRVGVSVASHGGMDSILYYGCQNLGRSPLFVVGERSAYTKLFKPYLVVGEKVYRLELNATRVFPAGYLSRFAVPELGIEVEHRLVLITDAILHTVKTIRNRSGKKFALRIAVHDYTRRKLDGRKWEDWKEEAAAKAWSLRVTDPNEGEGESATWIGVVAEKPLTTRVMHSGRRFFEMTPYSGDAMTVAVFFGHEEKAFRRRALELGKSATKESDAAVAEWEERLGEVPKLTLGRPAVESFFRLSPLVLESVMPVDLPGAMRAAARDYWVWGWDTLVHIDAFLAAGQQDFVRQALGLYHRTAHPTKGVGHQFTIGMDLRTPQAPAAQGLYVYALYQYVACTGDRATLKEHYSLILTILKLAVATRTPNGLFTGPALFPDYPQFAGHTGKDISVFNNSIFYQAARTVEHLAGWMGDTETAKLARDFWQQLGKSFDRLWDDKRGFWYDSLDSEKLTPRRSYPSHAVLCFSPFAQELLAGKTERVAAFMADHLSFSGGIRMYPLWDSSFNGDGNQFGQHYPVGSDILYLRTAAAAGRQEMLQRWLGWVGQLWEQNTTPEGVTVEAENEGPLYPDCPGGKQPFSNKSWYMGILTGVVGLSFDLGGITLLPGLEETIRLQDISFGGLIWNFKIKGEGQCIKRLRVNGRELRGTAKIPSDLATKTMNVEIERGAASPGLVLLSADGAKLTAWKWTAAQFSGHLEAPGPICVRIAADRSPKITWDKKPISVDYDAKTKIARAWLVSETFGPIAGVLRVE